MRTSDTDFFRYFPASPRDRNWGLYVTGVGSTLIPPHYSSYPLSRHPDAYMYSWDQGRTLHEYQALYIYRGCGEFESISVGRKKVEPGTLILLFPGRWHRYRPRPDSGWEEYWVSFNGAIMDRLVSHGFFQPDKPLLPIGPEETVLRAFQELRDSAREQPIGFQQLQAARVTVILAAAQAAIGRHNRPQGEDLIRRAKAILEENVEGVILVSGIAQSLHLSEKHFRRLFKKHTGMSPYQYYLELKMHRARQMLLAGQCSVKQIAHTLGFDSPFHFSVIFKQKTGLPPTQWRDRKQPRGIKSGDRKP